MALTAPWHASLSTIWSQLTVQSHPHMSASAKLTYLQHLCFSVLCDRYAFAHVLLLLEMPSPPSRPTSPNSSSHVSSFGKPLQILPTPVGSKPLLPWNSHSNLSVTHLLGTTISSVCEHYNYRCTFLLSLRAKRCVRSTVTAPKNVSE